MFYFLSKTLFLLAMPITWLVLLLGYAWFVKSSKRKNIALFLGLSFLFTAGNPLIVNKLLLWWEVPARPFSNMSSTRPYELGIILCGAVNDHKSPHDRVHLKKAADRVIHSAELYHRGLVKEFIITGGYLDPRGNSPHEAADFAHLLKLCQVPDSVITLEGEAKNTRDNAVLTQGIIEEKYPNLKQPPLLITSAFHMRRSLACFEKVGINAEPFSVDFYTNDPDDMPLGLSIWPREEALMNFYVFIHEVVGLTVYRLMGYA